MRDTSVNYPIGNIPMHWKYVLLFVAIGKAAVLGASVGLASLGALDVAFAASASDWLTEVRREYAFDYFALGGGAVGAIWKFCTAVIFR